MTQNRTGYQRDDILLKFCPAFVMYACPERVKFESRDHPRGPKAIEIEILA